MIEYVSCAPVIEYVAPAPDVTLSVPSQQLHPAYTMTTVTTDDSFIGEEASGFRDTFSRHHEVRR